MAERKTVVILTERVRIEEDKIKALEARKADPAQQKPYAERKTATVAVRSTSSPNLLWYRVPVSVESLTKIAGGTDQASLDKLGLMVPTGVPEGNALRTNKYATFDYPKVLIVHGTGTPTRVITPWTTKWTKKYEKNGKQSHRLIPFGAINTATNPDFEEVNNYFETQFGTGGPLRALLGTNGSASLMLGKNSVVQTIKIVA